MGSILESLGNWLVEMLVAGIGNNVANAIEIFNQIMQHALDLLQQNPDAWNRQAWSVVSTAYSLFVGVGSSLVVLFFLIGFCSDSIDIKQDLRMENILRMFIQLAIAEFFVTNSMTIVQGLFAMVGQLTNGIFPKTDHLIQVPKSITKMCANPLDYEFSVGDVVFSVIFSAVFLIVMIGCALLICYQAYIRFFKVLICVPYGALANSTLAGNHQIRASATAFWKYALCSVLEAVTMILAVKLCTVILTSGSLALFESDQGNLSYLLFWQIEGIFIALVTLGSVKGASNITQRVLGL